jgi:S-(hydroxymethyl)mycothiol dehydrogenase
MTLTDGTSLSPALGIGAFAERTVVAAGQCTKVDSRARPEAAGLLGCGVMAGFGAAANTAGIRRGETVAVFGCGGVGDGAIAAAALAGARKVIAIDIDAKKLEWARSFGATDVVDASKTDPVAAVQALTDGLGADVCIEAVGDPKVFEQAFYARDLAGTLVQVGVPGPQERIELPMIDFFGRGGALKPSWYGDCLPTRDFPALIELYLQGKFDLDRFVSETIGLDDVEAAFDRMQRGEVLRSVVCSEADGRRGARQWTWWRAGRVAACRTLRRPARGTSGLRRARCWVTPSRGDPQESATENRPPMAGPVSGAAPHRQG